MYYSATFSVGSDHCLTVVFDDGGPALVILADDTRVTQDGLETPEGDRVAWGQQVDVLRANADYFDEPLDGLSGCEASERAGVRFGETP